MRAVLPSVAALLGVAAIVAGVAGMAGLWWSLIAGGIFALVWAVLTSADRGGA